MSGLRRYGHNDPNGDVMTQQAPARPARESSRAVDLLARVDPRPVAVVVIAITAFLVLKGVGPTVDRADGPWDLDEEHNPAAWVSALVLLAAGAASLIASRRPEWSRTESWSFVVFGAFLGFMATDEWFVIHERVEYTLDIDWQTAYLPLIAAGGVAWLVVARQLRQAGQTALALHVTGASLWAISQVIEYVQHEHDLEGALIAGLEWTIVVEEAMELLGSLFFLLAILQLVRVLRQPVSPRA